MIIRGGENHVSPAHIAEAIHRGERVEIDRALSLFARASLEQELSMILGKYVELACIRPHKGRCSRYRIRVTPYKSLANSHCDDLEGEYVQLDPKELALATVLA